jgi:hypothetical protein
MPLKRAILIPLNSIESESKATTACNNQPNREWSGTMVNDIGNGNGKENGSSPWSVIIQRKMHSFRIRMF